MRRENKGVHEVSNWRNIEANKHIEVRLNALGHLRDRRENYRYWKEGLTLLNSGAFRQMAFNYVCSGWYANMTTKEVNKILSGVKEITQELRTEIDLRRVYIPKANNKVRPLGVPTKSWRVYLHMLNVLIVWFRTGTDKHQHAYFPGKGVHTAWQDLLTRLEEPNIYEFDLTSFFPSVNLEANKELLENMGIPPLISGYFRDLNRSITKLCDKDEMDETRDRKVLLTSDGQANPNLPKSIHKPLSELIEELRNHGKGWMLESESFVTQLESQGYTLHAEVGVPQGAATSCGLATVNLHYIWKRLGNTLLMYADDGLVFPRTGERPNLSDPARGISENEDKSGWVRKDGIWHKPLKFLGLEYLPATASEDSRIRAKTRNGSTKEFSLDMQLMTYLLKEKDLLIWQHPKSAKVEPIKVWSEDTESETEIVIPERYDPSPLDLELLYSSNRKKPRGACLPQTSLNVATLREIIQQNQDEKVIGWIKSATDRFEQLKEPLKLLFEKQGLSSLSRLYSVKESEATSNLLTSKKGSWIYSNWGEVLREMVEYQLPFQIGNAKLDEIKEKLDLWEAIPRILPTLFKTKKEQVTKLVEIIKGKELESYKDLRTQMVRYLRNHRLSLQNASSLASSYLLENGLHIPPSVVQYCTVNRIGRPIKQTAEKQELANRQLHRKQEKEFRRDIGFWPRKLKIPPRSLSPPLRDSLQFIPK